MSDKHSQREMRENEDIQKRNEAVKRTLQGLDEAGAEKRSEAASASRPAEIPSPAENNEASTVDPHDPFADDARAEVLRLQAQLEEAQRQLAEARSGSAIEEPESFYVPGLQTPPPAVPSGDPNWDGPQVAPPTVPSAPIQPQAMPQDDLPPQSFDPAAEEPDPAALASLAKGEETELEIELPEEPEQLAPPEPPAYVLEHEKQRADEDPAQRGSNPFPDLEGEDPEPPPPPPMPEPPQETSDPVIPEDSPTAVRRRRRQG